MIASIRRCCSTFVKAASPASSAQSPSNKLFSAWFDKGNQKEETEEAEEEDDAFLGFHAEGEVEEEEGRIGDPGTHVVEEDEEESFSRRSSSVKDGH